MTDGERWTRELLAELRASRYRPRAWSRFLARSFDRAAERRRERPRAHRQALALGAAGLLPWLGFAAGGRPLLAAAGVAWWALVVLMLDWHLGMLERPDGRPLDGIGVANALGLARAALVPALAALPPEALVWLLLAAGVADGIDGALARARDEVTRLGLWLDGAVDGFVLAAAAVGAARAGALPWWVVSLVAARYGLPWALAALAYFVRAEQPPQDGYVSGRIPGCLCFAGLMLALLEVPAGAAVAAAGAAGGLATLAAATIRIRFRAAAASG